MKRHIFWEIALFVLTVAYCVFSIRYGVLRIGESIQVLESHSLRWWAYLYHFGIEIYFWAAYVVASLMPLPALIPVFPAWLRLAWLGLSALMLFVVEEWLVRLLEWFTVWVFG